MQGIDKTDQLWAIESIVQTSLLLEPSGVPLSNQARLYHSPSQAFLSIFAFNLFASFLQVSANVMSLCKLGVSPKLFSISYRKKASQTLSPWWFYVPLMGLFSYLFYTSPRAVTIYWACIALFILTAMGSGFGGILGGISILIYGYAVYKKIKENANNKPALSGKETA